MSDSLPSWPWLDPAALSTPAEQPAERAHFRAERADPPALRADPPVPAAADATGEAGGATDAVLGRRATLPASPHEAELDTMANPHPGQAYAVRFTCPEFTSLCPITGQPDFAHFVIDYAPDATIIESKSLKLFLASFRNHGAFHEDCTLLIARRLVAALEPRWLRIAGYWYPRGGIPIDVFYQTGAPPAGLWLPAPEVAPYRGRG